MNGGKGEGFFASLETLFIHPDKMTFYSQAYQAYISGLAKPG
jgi:hypothetical protein